MDLILTNGSLLVSSLDLLEKKVKPNALSIYNLALLIENIILHDEMVIVCTENENSRAYKRLQKAANAIVPNQTTIHFTSILDLLFDYTEEFIYSAKNVRQDYDKSRFYIKHNELRTLQRIEDEVFAFSKSPYHEVIKDIYEHYSKQYSDRKSDLIVQKMSNKRIEHKLNKGWLFFREGNKKEILKSAYAQKYEEKYIHHIFGNLDILNEYIRFESILNPNSNSSSHARWRNSLHSSYRDFSSHIVIRNNLYEIASRKFGIPYKPDAIRTPLSLFPIRKKDEIQAIASEEKCIRIIEKLESERVNDAMNFIEHKPILSKHPLFLKGIIREAKSPYDLIRIALEYRETNSVKNYRDASARLRTAIKKKEIESIIKEVQQLKSTIANDFSKDSSDGISAIVPIIKGGFKYGASGFTYGGDSMLNISSLATKGISKVSSLWKKNPYSMVSKFINLSRKVDSFNDEIERLFHYKLDESELNILEGLQKRTNDLIVDFKN